MRYKYLKRCEDKISVLGFGCLRLTGVGENDVSLSNKDAKELLLKAYEYGINYYDTGYFYGTSEVILGEVFSNVRDKVYIATKLPMMMLETKEDVERIFNDQLNRLNSSYIDYYLLHAVDDSNENLIEKLNIYEFLQRNKRKGLIKHIGFSFHGSDKCFKFLIDNYKWEIVQVQYNICDNDLFREDFKIKYAKEQNIDVFIMSPLKGGLLTKTFSDKREILGDDESKNNLARLIFKWLLGNENIDMVLSGTNNEEILKKNVDNVSGSLYMTDDEISRLKVLKSELQEIIKVLCTKCGYCLPCPFNVGISDNFKIFNDYSLHTNSKNFVLDYISLKQGMASNCKKCNACINKCPQKINIPQVLEQVAKSFKEKKREI